MSRRHDQRLKKALSAVLLAISAVFSVVSPVRAGVVTYVFTGPPTTEWPGNPPPGWPGTNPGPNHDSYAVVQIPKFYLPGTTYLDTIYRGVLTGTASHDGFAVAQLYSLGDQTPRSDLPGGVQYFTLPNGFVRELALNITSKSVNGTGPGYFLRGWPNDSDLKGTDFNQFHPAVVQAAARLRPPSFEYYSTSASVTATWYVTHQYSGIPDIQEAPDKFQMNEAQKIWHLSQANEIQAKQNAIDVSEKILAIAGIASNLAGNIIQSIHDAGLEVANATLSENGGTWGEIIAGALSIIAGFIAFYVASGGISAAVALTTLTASTTLLFANSYYEFGKNYHLRKYADPPNANFTIVDQYNGSQLMVDLGLGTERQAFFEEGYAALSRSIDSNLGILNAYERGQGAIEAGDFGAAWFQARSLERFQADEAANDLAAENWLRAAGVGSTPSEPPVGGAVPEPSVWLMMIVGFGLIGRCLRGRELKTRSTLAGA